LRPSSIGTEYHLRLVFATVLSSVRAVIIFDRSGGAISFNDESSPHTHQTGRTKVSIDAQVNRALSLDWFHKLRGLFPDLPGEVKSAVVIAKFKDVPVETRDLVWRRLQRVRIHIVDPRPHYRRFENIVRRSWKNLAALESLRAKAAEGSPQARYMLDRMREFVAESVLADSTAVRVQSLGRALSDPLFGMNPPEPLSPFFGRSTRELAPAITLEDFTRGREGERDVVRNVASWSAKAAAAFHAALDAVHSPEEDDAMAYRFDFGRTLRKRMSQELIPSHAFDKGNKRHIDLLEQSRQSIMDELSADDHFYELIGRRPGFVEVESNESYYVQAADFAAGIASDIYATHKLIGVVERFEYVTFNGERMSRADAEEEMRNGGLD
jgi:hypothetical protein